MAAPLFNQPVVSGFSLLSYPVSISFNFCLTSYSFPALRISADNQFPKCWLNRVTLLHRGWGGDAVQVILTQKQRRRTAWRKEACPPQCQAPAAGWARVPGDTASRWGSSACLPCGCRKTQHKEARQVCDCRALSLCQDLSGGPADGVKSLDGAVKGSATGTFFILSVFFLLLGQSGCSWQGGQFGRAVTRRVTRPIVSTCASGLHCPPPLHLQQSDFQPPSSDGGKIQIKFKHFYLDR